MKKTNLLLASLLLATPLAGCSDASANLKDGSTVLFKIGSSKVINTVAKTTFGVYIFHENPLFCSYGENGLSDKGLLFERWLHIGEHFESDILYSLYFLGCVIFVFACCSMIEFLRQNLCVFVERLCRKYCNRGNCKF